MAYDTAYAACQNKTMKLDNLKQVECWKKDEKKNLAS